MSRNDYTRKGNCECGISYKGHPACKDCKVLTHTQKKFCVSLDSRLLIGYVPIGNICYPCIRERRRKKREENAKSLEYRHVQAKRKRRDKRYREKYKEELKVKARSKKNRWPHLKMRLASDLLATQKRAFATQKWKAKNKDRISEYNKAYRLKHKRPNEKLPMEQKEILHAEER